MKLILLSDTHLVAEKAKPVCRLDNVYDTQFGKLQFVYDYALQNDIFEIIQAGDMVDTYRDWGLLAVLTKFFEHYKQIGISTYSLIGQHDSYFHSVTSEKTILGILFSSGLVKRLTAKPTLIDTVQGMFHKFVNVYGASYGEDIPVVEKYDTAEIKILVIHKQILMKKIFSQQEGHDYAPTFLHDHSEFDLILCGDAHQKFFFKEGNRYICNTGAMLRLEANEYNMQHKPGFFVFDTDTRKLEWVEIPHEPSSIVISNTHLVEKKDKQQSFSDFIEKVKQTSGKTSVSFSRNMVLYLKRNNVPDNIREHLSKYLAGVS
jgi:DNA repair exonuclease SbcCD nuclease subunit